MVMLDTIIKTGWACWALLGQMSPYLLFGFLAAGFLSIWIPPALVERHLGGRGFMAVVKAAALGVPLPLCSCSVLPVAASLRRHGASRAAVASFLLSTPQTGVDSIAVTYRLMDPLFAAFRVLMALLAGLLGGLLVMLGRRRNDEQAPTETPPQCHECCCADKHAHGRLRRALTHGLVELPRDIGLPLLVGTLVAGAAAALAPADQWREYLGGGLGSILLAMALGVPIYVCATASVPIAVGLLHLGASPGVALAFLISGPATNAAAIAAIWKFLGGHAASLYLLTIALTAVAGGLALDWLYAALDHARPAMATVHEHHAAGVWTTSVWAVILLAVLVYSYYSKPGKPLDEDWLDE
jgi:uncharacterized membrane protein YraQ (UPF0718 family)